MANALYPLFKQSLLKAGVVDLSAVGTNVKVILTDTNGGTPYTYSASHQFLSDVPSAARTATSGNLASKAVSTTGVFSAANITISGVTGQVSEALILYIDTGTASTSQLIAYFDTSVTNLPFTPNGGPMDINWNGSGIFQL